MNEGVYVAKLHRFSPRSPRFTVAEHFHFAHQDLIYYSEIHFGSNYCQN